MMETKKKSDEIVLVFEISNDQTAFARCLGAIRYFENNVLGGHSHTYEYYSIFDKIPSSCLSFHVYQRREGPNDKMENPIKPHEYARIPVAPKDEQAYLACSVNAWREDPEHVRKPHYHIRVRFDYEPQTKTYINLDNLQFLAMLMQELFITGINTDFDSEQLKPSALKERMSVFLIPYTGVNYQFAGEDTEPDQTLYTMASQYLRMTASAHNGVIFGCTSEKVEALTFSERKRDNTLFPLLYLGNTSQKDNYHAIFEASGMPDKKIIRNSFTYRTNNARPFNDASNPDPYLGIADLIMDEARERILHFFAFENEQDTQTALSRADIMEAGRTKIAQLGLLDELVNIVSQYDRFTFALFGYLLYTNSKHHNQTVLSIMKETMKLALELSNGTRHIVQNSLQHSQFKRCFISFLKIKAVNPSLDVDEMLCIRVADLNTKDTILQNFTKKLKTEERYEEFEKRGIPLSLSNLIGEFGSATPKNTLEAWYAYRKKDAAAHIGLTMFHNTLKRCQYTELQIISNTTGKLEQGNAYIAECGREKDIHFCLPDYAIPGTQISFSIPITSIKYLPPVNLVQLSNTNAFSESYIAYTHFLKHTISHVIWHEPEPAWRFYALDPSSAESKLEIQTEWRLLWATQMEELSAERYKVHLFDIDRIQRLKEFLREKDNCEVFIKGILAASSVYIRSSDDNQPLCLHFKNLPDHFFDILLDVSIPISLMDFSQDLQLCFTGKVPTDTRTTQRKEVILLGNCVGHATQNAYIMSLEHGVSAVDTSHYVRASEMLFPYRDVLAPSKQQHVCPFSVIVTNVKHDIPDYFKNLTAIAKRPIVDSNWENRGYRFEKIHMRLGNKVHVTSFYELSFLFYRTSVANSVAFYIIQNIKEDLARAKGTIVFYGYASYSQALVFSLKEMLSAYFDAEGIKKDVHCAIYQYNLQTESDYSESMDKPQDKTQVYTTLPKGERITTSIIQVVPIGSTQTTFSKMRAKYINDRKDYEQSEILVNYNVFLVRDSNIRVQDGCTDIEKDLWVFADSDARTIIVDDSKLLSLAGASTINYIVEAEACWYRPTKCELCFPSEVHTEVPLVETDPTSTVPTLQIFQKDNHMNGAAVDFGTRFDTDTIIRLSELQDCVYYGHFLRGKNHYQYYIDTQSYISKFYVRQQLEKWLKSEKEKYDEALKEHKITTPVLNIIFSPEHNTNVGFSQLVNAYFFQGTAEIVSVNLDKQFRSNFLCEHDALRQTIERLLSEDTNDSTPIRFFFVDDSIITGSNFFRAKNLLQSLIPEKYRERYRRSLFDKCFVMVDRLSLSSREAYVADPQNNYLSFCKINISNMRKQGDSCVGCKLEREAKHLFKRSTTRSFSNYWAKKTQDYSPIMFDNAIEMENYGGHKAFVRMILSHIAENLTQQYHTSHYQEFVDRLFNLLIIESRLPLKYDEQDNVIDSEEAVLAKIANNALPEDISDEAKIAHLIEHAIKIISRPFFTYNVELKQCIQCFVIELCETMLSDRASDTQGEILDSKYKHFTIEIKKIIKAIDKDGEYGLTFVKECLFDALTDMKSTYLLRKQTLSKMYLYTNLLIHSKSLDTCRFYCNSDCRCFPAKDNPNDTSQYPCNGETIRCFWKKYAFSIHKIIDGSGDETRSLWLEHLLLFGEEQPKGKDVSIKPKTGVTLPLFESIASGQDVSYHTKQLFKEFCTEILLQNSRLLYDGIEKLQSKVINDDPSDNSYFLENWRWLRNWNFGWAKLTELSAPSTEDNVINENAINSEIALFQYMESGNIKERDTKEKYTKFINHITYMAGAKYDMDKDGILIALVTQKGKDVSANMDTLAFIADNIDNGSNPSTTAKEKFIIKRRIIWALDNKIYGDSRLTDDGYCLVLRTGADNTDFDFECDAGASRKPFFILRFDNVFIKPRLHLDRDAQPIEKVYLYVSFKFKTSDSDKYNVVPIQLMRDILSYRNRIMRMLEKDFNSYLMQADASKTGENSILKHEKSVSHSANSDDRLPMLLWHLKKSPSVDQYEWLLFRNYTNMQIAKLFNRTLLLQDEPNNVQPNDKGDMRFYRHEHTPKLYLREQDIDPDIDFTVPAKMFLDDVLEASDRRIVLCREIIDFKLDGLENARMVFPGYKNAKGYFNQEYIKCVLFDIFFSCAKYWNENADFLSRISALKTKINDYNELKAESMTDSKNYEDSLRSHRSECCRVLLIRDGNNLAIVNPVKRVDNSIFDGWKERNEEAYIRLNNPQDSFDGHLSMFAISNYIKNNCGEVPSFGYVLFKDLETVWKKILITQWENPEEIASLWHISKIPIFAD